MAEPPNGTPASTPASADSPVAANGPVPAASVPAGRTRSTGAAGRVAWLPDYGVYLALGVLLTFNLVFTPNFATVIQHDLHDSTARMIQAAIIVAAVYAQRDRSRT
jgi:hypothetical protein